VKSISQAIEGAGDMTAAIASAITEQSATTDEIARNVSQTSAAAKEVAESIQRVSQEASSTGQRAHSVNDLSDQVAQSIEHLRQVLVRIVRTSTKEVDRRRKPRYRIDRPAKASCGAQNGTLTLVDISEGGARLTGTLKGAEPGAILNLSVAEIDLPLKAKVLAVNDETIHVEFDLGAEAEKRFLAAFNRLVAGKKPLRDAA